MEQTKSQNGLALRDFQLAGVRALRKNERYVLLVDMGMGKTAIVYSALARHDLPALVVAPKRVAELVWPEERDLWRPDLSVRVVSGNAKQRHRVINEPQPDVTVITRDNMREFLETKGKTYRTIILDELSSFKDRNSQRWKVARKLLKKFQPRNIWGMTGTPSVNGLEDLWAQYYLIDGGERLGTTLGGYRERYFRPVGRLPNGAPMRWELRSGQEQNIYGLIDDISMRMSAEEHLDLPEITYNDVRVPLPDKVSRLYQDLEETMVADLDLLGGQIHTATNAGTLTGKLSQLTAGFIYHDEVSGYDVAHREKIRALQEILAGTGDNVLVFYGFQAERDMIQEAIPHAELATNDVIQRWNQREVPVMMAHPASIGHGLNLQHGGNTAVWATLPWSLELWEQGNRRLHRQGQQQNVMVHVLTAPQTVDVAVRRRLRDKTSVQDALLNYLEMVGSQSGVVASS